MKDREHEKIFEGPAVGIPYAYAAPGSYEHPQQRQHVMVPPYQQMPIQYATHENPYQQGMIPPNAIFNVVPSNMSLRQTIFRDTPAPFECVYCGSPGLTTVKSKPSLAACVACMMSVVGICFLCPAFDCLWNKQHYCPSCGEKVAEFNKSDPCAVVDASRWTEPSFAIPL